MTKCQEKKVHADPIFLTLKDRTGAVICMECKTQISGKLVTTAELELYIAFAEALRERQKTKNRGL